ncbi:MAG: hypothetical protein WC346_09165 [Methanogenium sp.]|jgi:hypothetical protein
MVKKYELLKECVDALSSKVINLLILNGEAGFGKTFLTLNILEKNKVDFEYINTYSTPLAFYKFLYENKDKSILVFDDLHGISDPVTKSLFKSACGELPGGKRLVCYNSTSSILKEEEIPSEFELTSGIILIFNDDLKGFEPVINRGINIKFNFSFQDKIKIFEEMKIITGIDDSILNYVKLNCNASTKNLSIRTLVMLSKLKDAGYNYIEIADEILEKDEMLSGLIGLDEKEWCNKTGLNRRTYYRHKKKYGVT